MKQLSELLPRLMPYVVGCPEPLALQALVDSAIQFCDETQVLRVTLDPVTTQEGVVEYELDAPSQQQIGRVNAIYIDGVALTGIFAEDVQLFDTAGRPQAFYVKRDGATTSVGLFPTPDKAYTLGITVTTKPTRTATSVPDELINVYADELVTAARARLSAVPGQPYSDTQLSFALSTTAAVMRRKARIEGSVGQVRGTTRVKLRPFA